MNQCNPPKIKRFPDIHCKLLHILKNRSEANYESKLALFLGAGVSKLLGYPSWKDLAGKLINKCYEINEFSFIQKEGLEKEKDLKKVISICKQKLGKQFTEAVSSALKKKENPETKKYKDIYNLLFKLTGTVYSTKIFITTNIDESFDEKFSQEDIFYNNFSKVNDSPKTLYKIHGSISKPSSWTLTMKDYINRYYRHREFQTFIETVFSENSILFIGYSLKDRQILDSLLRFNKNQKNHFWLLPFFKRDKDIFDLEYDFYREHNIHLIPFSIDEKGYNSLYDVIKNWHKKFPQELGDFLHISNKIYEEI